MIVAAFTVGCLCALGWASRQTDVAEQSALPCDEPERPPGAPVTLVLVQSDGSPVCERIDLATGRLGFSHCYIDVGHILPDGRRLIVDYQPGLGVHYADGNAYAERGLARVRLPGAIGEQVYGCVRSKIGQPFDAAGMLVGRATVGTCAGLVYSCLPPRARCQMGRSGAPISPNDFAAFFGAELGRTVSYTGGDA